MTTKLSRYSDGVMEAAWLAALILTPLFFNVYSSRIFEPDKIAILRSLALVTLLAWVVKLAGQRREAQPSAGWMERVREFFKTPLAAPVTALAVIYLISTIFSVIPRTSFWGSYQRLQGTYTTFSYLVIFAAIAANLRRREQIERILLTVVITSLPIGLYGILQRLKLDPIPWGGDTSTRIAANMGNSIFVAAYLIMAIPIVVGRMLQAFGAVLREEQGLASNVARATVYVFILAVDIIAWFLSFSRGPFLGLLLGLFVLLVMLAWLWRRRWLTYTISGLTVLLGVFLIIFNLPNSPLAALRSAPGIGRYGLMLDSESNSAKVRQYIWEGAARLVLPHEPLVFPDGTSDRFNAIRPLIGYGPEAMYVAYNPFYIPELGQVEKRNASPDRSHNETWDAVVINGFLGLAVYLALYSSVFYFGLKWIGLIADRRQYGLFWGLLGGGAALGTAAAVAWRGFEWFGLGLPIGMLAGVVFYLLIITAFFPYGPALKKHQAEATMAAIMLFAALSAHFFEINFGIAIVSTRTHFWVYTAVMFVLGMVFSRTEYIASREAAQPAPAAAAEDPSRAAGKKSAARPAKAKRKRSEREGLFGGAMPGWAREMFIAGGLVGIILGTLGYLYLTNARRTTSALEIVVNSLTQLPNRNFAASYGLLALVLTAFAAAAVLLAAELYRGGGARRWWQGMGIISATAWGLALLFWLWNAGTQAALAGVTPTTEQMVIDQVGGIAGIMTIFYVFFLVVIFALGALLPEDWPAAAYAPGAAFIGAVGLVAAAVLINVTNLRIIHADITYKMADPFTRGNQWPVATLLYKQAIRQAPDEDFYYLFLGRSYLEQAKLTQDPAIQTQLVQEAERDLVEAQGINPLNTDHTANLARLFSYWATTTTDPKIRMERALRSNQYYRTALTLSPNNSTLLGEWAILNLDILNDPGEAFRLLTRAIELDPMYNLTQNLMGNYYVKISQQFTDTAKVNTTLEQAAFHYNEAYNAINSYTDPQIRINSLLSLADVYRRLNRLNDSISSYELALQTDTSSPNTWRIEATIAQLYVQLGDKANAQRYVDAARLAAPPDQVAALDALGQQIQAMP